MADKKRITAIIDSIEERLEDNDRGWGKYKVRLAGYDGVHKVDVPAEINAEFDLEEGNKVTLTSGAFKGWIVHSKSECFTGEPFPDYSDVVTESSTPVATVPKTIASKKKSLYGKSETTTAATETKFSKPKSGLEHTSWNQYQIDVRDPQIRIQEITKIVAGLYSSCIQVNMDIEDIRSLVQEVFVKAKEMDQFLTS